MRPNTNSDEGDKPPLLDASAPQISPNPSPAGDRSYRGPSSVGREYDVWTADGVLERFWGEHIHHGYYPQGLSKGIDFQAAKVEMVDRLLDWAKVESPQSVIDIGCGIGGSARHLALRYQAQVVGVSLSSAQVSRARDLTPPGLPVVFEVADALRLPFSDRTFDLVWSCESGEHMPDKDDFFREMVRVLAPGGHLVLATWCRRENSLSSQEQRRLDRIYREWALPPFVTLESYARRAEADRRLKEVRVEDWSRYASPTWGHQLRQGLRDLPWLLRQGGHVLWRSLRDARAVRDMILGYRSGSIRYGLLRATRAQ